MAIAPGAPAPPVDGITNEGARALVFFKVTCSTTHLATPAIERLARAYPGLVFGVGEDDRAALDTFAETFGLSMPLVSDPAPYLASDAYGIESAPTAVAIGADGGVLDVAESWIGRPGTGSPPRSPPRPAPRRGRVGARRRAAGFQTRLNHAQRPLGLSGHPSPGNDRFRPFETRRLR